MSRRDDRDADALAPIALRDARLKRNPAARPWSWRLHLFVRAVAVAELAKGLHHWAALIGLGSDGAPFADADMTWRVATVVFAVVDLVAAVGLWLGAAWGVVIWLIAACGQLLLAAFAPSIDGAWALAALQLAAMAAYLALSLLAKREEP